MVKNALKKFFLLNFFSFLALIGLIKKTGADEFPVYIVTVSNLRQAAQDQRECDQAFHAIQNIVLESHRFSVDFVNENLLKNSGLKLQTLVIDSCYNADWSQQQVDCIFLRAEPFGLIPNGMCKKRKFEAIHSSNSEWNITKGMLVAVMGPMSSNTAEQYANFMQQVKKFSFQISSNFIWLNFDSKFWLNFQFKFKFNRNSNSIQISFFCKLFT